MRRLPALSRVMLSLLALVCLNAPAAGIFPGAVGFGTESRGAYATETSPTVLVVDTLAADEVQTGPRSGSFRWCATRPFPRVVLFAVSGVIDCSGAKAPSVDIRNPYLNVYGQTAPENGVTLFAVEVYVTTHDVLFQHVKFRQSDSNPKRLVNRCVGIVGGARDVVFDHCSFSFANDEVFTVWEADRNITLSNSIVSFALHESHHVNERGAHEPESHGYSVLFKAKSHTSLIGNFLGYGVYRFPAWDTNTGLILNNFSFAVGRRGIAGPNLSEGGRGRRDVIQGNAFVHGANVDWANSAVVIQANVDRGASVWVRDNLCNLNRRNSSLSDWQCVTNHAGCAKPSAPPFDLRDFPSIPASRVEAHVCANAGAFPWARDWIDELAINSAKQRRDFIVNSPAPLPARAYNRGIHQGLRTVDGSMADGFDFAARNVQFTVNGKPIVLTERATGVRDVLEMVNAQLPDGCEAVKHAASRCSHIILQTRKRGSQAVIEIGGDASVFGIPNGTFHGEDGIGGYPRFPARHHKLKIPPNPHADDDGDGYTNLENWASSIPARRARESAD